MPEGTNVKDLRRGCGFLKRQEPAGVHTIGDIESAPVGAIALANCGLAVLLRHRPNAIVGIQPGLLKGQPAIVLASRFPARTAFGELPVQGECQVVLDQDGRNSRRAVPKSRQVGVLDLHAGKKPPL